MQESRLERLVKSFTFSAVLFVVWGLLTASHVRSLVGDFRWMELLWTAYNSLLAVLFLVRSRPSAVSLHPVHWLVALITSFAGMFFRRNGASLERLTDIGDGLIVVAVVGSIVVAVSLGRSYDFLPALREVQTQWLYRFVRHPMYTFSITIRLGYLFRSFSLYNALIFILIVALYRLRAGYEEQIMCRDARYADYQQRVRYRFLPHLC